MSLLVLIRHGQSQWNLENRFTGWVDVPLSPKGRLEAEQGAGLINDIRFNRAVTSALQRAQETLRIVMEEIGQPHIPVEQDKALNERHYGALQGLNKAEVAKQYGDEQVHIWRRSYDIAPPKDKTPLNPDGVSESLQDTAARTIPYYIDKIEPHLRAGENILVAAHGNSLRSIVMHLDHLSREQVLELNIATGAPIVYDMDASGKVIHKKEHALIQPIDN